jgi:hypothetical protein
MQRIGEIPNSCKCLWIQIGRELAGVQLVFLGSTLSYRPQPPSRSEEERDQPAQQARCAYFHQRTDNCARYLLRMTPLDGLRSRCWPCQCGQQLPPHRTAQKVRRARRTVHRESHRLLLQPPIDTQLGSVSKLPKNIPSIAHELPSQAHLLFKFRIIGSLARASKRPLIAMAMSLRLWSRESNPGSMAS